MLSELGRKMMSTVRDLTKSYAVKNQTTELKHTIAETKNTLASIIILELSKNKKHLKIIRDSEL